MYFTVAEGKPLRQRRYYYSEAFYALANAEYYGVTGDRECLERARKAYEIYWDLSHGGVDPVGLGPKTIAETRSGRSFGPPMIILNVTGVLIRVDPERKKLYEARAQQCVDEIFKYHVKPELKCLLENVDIDGTPRLYYTEGRIVNPGHDIEGAWFMLEHAKRTRDKELVAKCAQIFDWAIEAGWDCEYGGLLYFIDCSPPEAYEHDMKLWWPQQRNNDCISDAYRDTGEEKYLIVRQNFGLPCSLLTPNTASGTAIPPRRLAYHAAHKGKHSKGPFHSAPCFAMCDLCSELIDD